MKPIKPPAAWIGYEWHNKVGFIIKICQFCEDRKQALEAARPLRVRLAICAFHASQRNEKQIST